MMKIVLVLFVTIFPTICLAQIFGPKTYEDCVHRGLKDIKTDSALAALYAICQEKFSSSSNVSRSILLKKTEAKLLCDASLPGYLPWQVNFNRNNGRMFVNGREFRIHSSTSQMLYVRADADDVFTLNLQSSTFTIQSKNGAVVSFSCEIATAK